MRTTVRTAALRTLALALVAASLPLSAGRPVDDALALVPPDAVSVGMIRMADLRTNPLSAELFRETDRITIDGDAARFLEDARLAPKEDIDVVVVAGSPKSAEGAGNVLVLLEGRFDPARLSAAVATRGAIARSSAQGEYFLLNDKNGAGKEQGAVAFASPHLIIAGGEPAVLRAMVQRGVGGTGFSSGTGLGRQLSRIDTGASAWALVDMTKMPKVNGKVRLSTEGGNPIAGAMKSMSLVALQATVKGDALKLSAQGMSEDTETLELLEDTLKGVFAAWRMAVADKSPDMVSVLRKFKVERNGDSVTVSGTLPGAAVRAMAEKVTEHRDQSAHGGASGTTGK